MKYCVYLTVYFGTLLPKRYIGSSSVKKISNGYNGSVSSKKWKDIYINEQRNNKQLFKTRILSLHETRDDALINELKIHQKYDVINSPIYMNESYARQNGFFGRDVSGSTNPMYGKSRRGEIHNNGENISKGLKKFYNSDRGILQKYKISQLFSAENNPMYGKRHTDEWKIQKSNNMLGNKHPLYGKNRSEETRLKISNTRKQRSVVPWNKSKEMSEEQKKKMRKPKKRYIIDENIIVENAMQYCLDHNICYTSFINAANTGKMYKNMQIRKLKNKV